MSLLDANHPPMLLRVALVIGRQLMHYDSPMIEQWGHAIMALLDAPYKGAAAACLFPPLMAPDGMIFQAFPALEGLQGAAPKDSLAYPSKEEQEQMHLECSAHADSKKAL